MTSKTGEGVATYVVDTNIWIDYFDGTPRGIRTAHTLRTARLFTTTVTVAELVAKITRDGKDERIALQAVRECARILPIDEDVAIAAGQAYPSLRKQRPKIALSDVLSLCLARKLGAKVLSSDTDFKGLKDAVFVE